MPVTLPESAVTFAGIRRDEELVDAPCPHTLFVAHDTGFEYIPPQVAVQLRDRGYQVDIGNDGFVEINHDDESQPLSPDELTDSLEFADGSKVASYEAAPGEMGTMWVLRPLNMSDRHGEAATAVQREALLNALGEQKDQIRVSCETLGVGGRGEALGILAIGSIQGRLLEKVTHLHQTPRFHYHASPITKTHRSSLPPW
jgi:hypothetical protein